LDITVLGAGAGVSVSVPAIAGAVAVLYYPAESYLSGTIKYKFE
jgi:hypothetical protein